MPASIKINSEYDSTGSGFRNTPLEHARTVLVKFIQGLFSSAPIGDYHWNESDEKTEIIIRDENPIHVDKYGMRPCINTTMGNIQFYSLGLDDMLDVDAKTGKKTKGILVPGTTSINICSRVDIEAHNLAWIVGEHIWLLRGLLMKLGFFEIGRSIIVTPPSPPGSIVASDSADEWFCSTVSIPWQFNRMSSTTPLGQYVINNILTQFSVKNLKRYESKGWPVAIGAELPVGIEEYLPPSFAPNATDSHGGTPDPARLISNNLIRQPHPLNPAKTVIVRTSYPYRTGLRGPSINGKSFP